MTNLDSVFKSRDITSLTNVYIVRAGGEGGVTEAEIVDGITDLMDMSLVKLWSGN